jgi:hypothetical protein
MRADMESGVIDFAANCPQGSRFLQIFFEFLQFDSMVRIGVPHANE